MKNLTIAEFVGKHSREEQFEIYIRFAEDIRNEEAPEVGNTFRMIRDNWKLINNSNKKHFAQIVRALQPSKYMTGIFAGYMAYAIDAKEDTHHVISRAG